MWSLEVTTDHIIFPIVNDHIKLRDVEGPGPGPIAGWAWINVAVLTGVLLCYGTSVEEGDALGRGGFRRRRGAGGSSLVDAAVVWVREGRGLKGGCGGGCRLPSGPRAGWMRDELGIAITMEPG